MQSPKIVVIGAGSFFFGRPVIWNMVSSEILKGGTLALVDTNPQVLETMMKLGRLAIEATGSSTTLIGSVKRRDVLKDADFVVLTFSDKNAYYRELDCEVALKYGVRMCSGDTIGPGGIFRSLREIPRALEMAKDIEELAPNSWTVNFVNPTSTLGIALMRHAPNIRSFAICDGLHEPGYRLKYLKELKIVGADTELIPPEVENKLEFHSMGVNHFTWVTKFSYEGKDRMPDWKKIMDNKAAEELSDDSFLLDNNASAKAKYNFKYIVQLMELFKAYPDRIGHAKEYVPYFQGLGVLDNQPAPISIFDAERRQKLMDERWNETEDYANGRKPIQEFLDSGRGDHATDIIESMWGGLNKSFYINCPNNGAVGNMADDAFLEALCDLDMTGPRPRPMGAMPRGLLGLQQQVLDTHELTVEAAVNCDREILLRAMMVDPIVNNIEDGKRIMEELLEQEKYILPEKWYK
jgi:alpha-galactosidase